MCCNIVSQQLHIRSIQLLQTKSITFVILNVDMLQTTRGVLTDRITYTIYCILYVALFSLHDQWWLHSDSCANEWWVYTPCVHVCYLTCVCLGMLRKKLEKWMSFASYACKFIYIIISIQVITDLILKGYFTSVSCGSCNFWRERCERR